jgi:aminopeptidase N
MLRAISSASGLGLLALAFLLPLPARAEDAVSALACSKSAAFLAPADSPDHRKYAPVRDVDILHLALDVTPDFKQRTVAVVTRIAFKPLAQTTSELRLDATKLSIDEVTATEAVQAWNNTDQQLVITFAKPLPSDRETTVTIRSRAEPKQGLYFRTPEMGYREGDTHLFTQGESIEARQWFPCFDAPNEKFTSEITCRVPEGMTVLSNGRKVSSEKEAATGLVAVRWVQEQPHVTYLISLVAGYFKTIEARHGDLPLAYHVLPTDADAAAGSFQDTAAAVAFFEKEIGVKYPWVKYDQVCVNDFVAGGMENTSLTTLTDGTLFPPGFETLRSSQSLMAHELVHQWFGDLVTCKDWTHLWLNEGAATYYAHLFDGHMNGRDAMLYGLYEDARGFLDVPNDVRPIADRTFDDPMQQFGYHAYQKGSWVLHMLRSQLGDELYRRCIQTYLERHRFGNVVTEDLNRVLEEISGKSWDQFFDQWVYHAHHPELEIAYAWDEGQKQAKVSVRQVQKLSDAVLLFKFPLPIRFKTREGVVDRTVTVRLKEEDFRFTLASAPESVRIDPGLTVLAKISFTPPIAMAHAQLKDPDDVIGRLLAVAQIGRNRDHETLARLKATLNADPFYGVRLSAARALRGIHNEEALDALLDSLKQDDARVRREVVSAVASFYRERAYAALRQTLETEKNPDIRATALRGLGAYAKHEVRDMLIAALTQDSFRNVVGDAAIGAIREQDDAAYIAPLQECLGKRESAFTAWGFADALGVLARLSRNETNKETVREFLVARLDHKRQSTQIAAIRALGTLGDAKATAILNTYLEADKDAPLRGPAEEALNGINSRNRAPDAQQKLRNEVLELQRVDRELRKEIDELKNRPQPTPPKPGPLPPAKKPAKTTSSRPSRP